MPVVTPRSPIIVHLNRALARNTKRQRRRTCLLTHLVGEFRQSKPTYDCVEVNACASIPTTLGKKDTCHCV